jgi:hypothetical protein
MGAMSDFHQQFTLSINNEDGTQEEAVLIVGGYVQGSSLNPTNKELKNGPSEFLGLLEYQPNIQACAGLPLKGKFAGVIGNLRTGQNLEQVKQFAESFGAFTRFLNTQSPDPAQTNTEASSELAPASL